MARASGSRREFSIVEALDREWYELVRDHRQTAARWADQHDALAACRTLDDVLSAVRLDSDPVFAALLAEVSIGDQVAGRVVLQALLGRMVRMAQRDPRSSVDDYLALLWYVINNYPLQRRPARIAANLSLDTLKAVSREHRWLGFGDVTLWPSSESLEELLSPVGLDGTPDDSPLAVDVEVLEVLEAGRQLRLIDDSTSTLLHSVYIDGMTGTQSARRLHTSAGTIRVRCSKAVRRLAAHAVQLVDAAA
jgi:hypothetical protein